MWPKNKDVRLESIRMDDHHNAKTAQHELIDKVRTKGIPRCVSLLSASLFLSKYHIPFHGAMPRRRSHTSGDRYYRVAEVES